MKFISFNINSIRARLHQLAAIIERFDPDIIGLQETKVQDVDFPFAAVEALGYHASVLGQKSHHGVALLSKKKPLAVTLGCADDYLDTQARLIEAVFLYQGQKIYLFNGYFPQGENSAHPQKFPFKRAFYAMLTDRIKNIDRQNSDTQVIVMGDMNIAPVDADIGIGAHNKQRWLKTGKCSFLPEERAWMMNLLEKGKLTDSFRFQYPELSQFSWFDYRSKGFEDVPKRGLRIDLFLVSQALLTKVQNTGIAYDIRSMEKPSDHAPIWLELAV